MKNVLALVLLPPLIVGAIAGTLWCGVYVGFIKMVEYWSDAT